jgi:hypothetical protein
MEREVVPGVGDGSVSLLAQRVEAGDWVQTPRRWNTLLPSLPAVRRSLRLPGPNAQRPVNPLCTSALGGHSSGSARMRLSAEMASGSSDPVQLGVGWHSMLIFRVGCGGPD